MDLTGTSVLPSRLVTVYSRTVPLVTVLVGLSHADFLGHPLVAIASPLPERRKSETGPFSTTCPTLLRLYGSVLGDEIAEAQSLVQLPSQNQAPIKGYPRSLEIDQGVRRLQEVMTKSSKTEIQAYSSLARIIPSQKNNQEPL